MILERLNLAADSRLRNEQFLRCEREAQGPGRRFKSAIQFQRRQISSRLAFL